MADTRSDSSAETLSQNSDEAPTSNGPGESKCANKAKDNGSEINGYLAKSTPCNGVIS